MYYATKHMTGNTLATENIQPELFLYSVSTATVGDRPLGRYSGMAVMLDSRAVGADGAKTVLHGVALITIAQVPIK